jgi:TetR/AcrR family transcriptional regulator, transcriptional repressor for nem operon
MSTHIAARVSDIEAAKQCYVPDAAWSAESLVYCIRLVLQGEFIFATAKQTTDVARESLGRLRRYLEALFTQPLNLR